MRPISDAMHWCSFALFICRAHDLTPETEPPGVIVHWKTIWPRAGIAEQRLLVAVLELGQVLGENLLDERVRHLADAGDRDTAVAVECLADTLAGLIAAVELRDADLALHLVERLALAPAEREREYDIARAGRRDRAVGVRARGRACSGSTRRPAVVGLDRGRAAFEVAVHELLRRHGR